MEKEHHMSEIAYRGYDLHQILFDKILGPTQASRDLASASLRELQLQPEEDDFILREMLKDCITAYEQHTQMHGRYGEKYSTHYPDADSILGSVSKLREVCIKKHGEATWHSLRKKEPTLTAMIEYACAIVKKDSTKYY